MNEKIPEWLKNTRIIEECPECLRPTTAHFPMCPRDIQPEKASLGRSIIDHVVQFRADQRRGGQLSQIHAWWLLERQEDGMYLLQLADPACDPAILGGELASAEELGRLLGLLAKTPEVLATIPAALRAKLAALLLG